MHVSWSLLFMTADVALQAVEMTGDIGKDNVVVHLDTYHMNIEENSMEQAVRTAGDKLGCGCAACAPENVARFIMQHGFDLVHNHALLRSGHAQSMSLAMLPGRCACEAFASAWET